MNYPINNIYFCIQGEGCQVGIPMIMLRLQGCEVGCPWCDTKETWDMNYKVGTIFQALGHSSNYTIQSQKDITAYILENYPTSNWILISGGEPAQYPLSSLVNSLHKHNYRVALETSGTEYLDTGFDWTCVSPKIGMPGNKRVKFEVLQIADEIKYVVGNSSHISQLDTLLTNIQLKENCTVCLQPVSQSLKATQLCIKIVQERGWRLSIQLHKYLGLA